MYDLATMDRLNEQAEGKELLERRRIRSKRSLISKERQLELFGHPKSNLFGIR